jgi:hypothetical protein
LNPHSRLDLIGTAVQDPKSHNAQRRVAMLDGKPDLKRCRILIVEDEYFLADDLASVLRAHGADVVGPAR